MLVHLWAVVVFFLFHSALCCGSSVRGQLVVVQNVSWCRSDGVLQVRASTSSGGGGRLSYRLVGTLAWQMGAQRFFSRLPAGEHEVEVRDESSGQSVIERAALYRVTALKIVRLEIEKLSSSLSCSGNDRFTIKALINEGGFHPISYFIRKQGKSVWEACSRNGTCAATGAGTFFVKAVDVRGCKVVSLAHVIQEPVIWHELDRHYLRIRLLGRRRADHAEVYVDNNNISFKLARDRCLILRDLCSGRHLIRVVADGSCQQIVVTVDIVVRNALSISLTNGTAVSCQKPGLGRLFMNITGGVPPFAVSIDKKPTKSLVDREIWLTAQPGLRFVEVRDAEGLLAADVVEILEPEALRISARVLRRDAATAGFGGDGVAEIEAYAVSALTDEEVFFSIDGISWRPTGWFGGLSAGKHTVRARTSDCDADVTVLIEREQERKVVKWRYVAPIKLVEDLKNFPTSVTTNVRNDTQRQAIRKGLWLCHDFKGNYLDHDASLDTVWSRQEHFFHLRQWAKIDGFVYFSHALVCPPPPSWVRAAKRNLKPILGTFLTERNVSESRLLFSEPELFANKLIELAQAGGFDGWLVNIESVVPAEFLANVTLFLHTLKRSCIVIMYDSLVHDSGEVLHQNAVNHRNQYWLKFVDGFLVNYLWRPSSLPDNDDRVLVGVDAFGRGTIYGGGMESGRALEEVVRFNLSALLFAPGWTVEAAGKSAHEAVESEFWDGLYWNETFVSAWAQTKNGSWLGSFEIEVRGRERALARVLLEGGSCSRHCVAWCNGRVTDLGLVRESELAEVFIPRCVSGWMSVEVNSACASKMVVRYTNSAWKEKAGVGNIFASSAKVVEAPVVNHFCVGYGSEFWVDGIMWKKETWVNLGFQSRLPYLGFGPARSSWVGVSLRKAFTFGSSLHVVAWDGAERVTLFLIASEHQMLIMIHVGRIAVCVNDEHLDVLRSHSENGWEETTFLLGKKKGVMELRVLDGEAFLGAMLLVNNYAGRKKRCRFIDTIDDDGAVYWNDEVLGPFAITDIFKNDILVERLVAEPSGSFGCKDCQNLSICQS